MRIDEIISSLKEYIFLAIVGVIILAVIIGIGYIVYKKFLKGRKNITIKQMIMTGLISGYIIIVLAITILNRVSGIYGSVNLHFLSSYKEAWNNFSVRNWQYLIFNIIMFVPLGVLLPLTNKKFQKIFYTLLAGFMLTFVIEILQRITAYGIFELDDIFNNLLGTLVGYSIVMTFISLNKRQKHKYRKVFAYFSPLLIVLALFGGVFTYYNLKEFGNLSQNYDYKLNVKDTDIISDIVFSEDTKIVPVYKAPSLNKDKSKKFAADFFNNINTKIDTSNMEILDYHEEIVYRVSDYSLWLNNIDGSYRYTDFTFFDNGINPKSVSTGILIDELKVFNIDIPKMATFESGKEGDYLLAVDKKVVGNTLIDGVLSCSYYSDDTIKNIDNNLVAYEKVKDVVVISPKEAYEKITEGKFSYRIDIEKIDTIGISDFDLDYKLDSKGYLQPVYVFSSLVNGEPFSVVIPALDKK